MNGKFNREEIVRFLSNKLNRKEIINSVLNNAQKILYEIGMNNPEIWEICAYGSYADPDPMGRWPRIVLPQYPNIFVPPIYVNRRGRFVYGPSDFDVTVITDDTYTMETEFLNPLDRRTNVKRLLERFRRMTGVNMSFMVVSGVFNLGEEGAHKHIFQYEKYVVVYRRQEQKCQIKL